MLSVSSPRVHMSRHVVDPGQLASCRCRWGGRTVVRATVHRRRTPCVCFVATTSKSGLAAIDVPAEAVASAAATTRLPERLSVSSLLDVVSDDLLKLNNNLKSLIGAENPVLVSAAEQIFGAGGKRLRPALVFLVSRATAELAGLSELTTEHQRLAEIIEMIHTASLIHDDVIDDSGMRRGKETIHQLYGTRIAVLAGDFMFAQSSWFLANLENIEVIKLISQVIKDFASGEIKQQSTLFDCDVTLDDYLLKSYYKTASLLASSTRSAAIFSGVSTTICAGSAASMEEKQEADGGAVQPPPPGVVCTTCAKGRACQAVVSRTQEMRALIDAKKPHQAHALFEHLADEGHRPSLVTYTTLLSAVTSQRAFEAIPSLLADIDAAGLRPDSIFFNALINAFVEAGRMGEATSTFWKMSRHHPGCRPTISTFNTLVKGFGIAGRPDESQRIFDVMAGGAYSTVRPNLTTYNILVKAWCDQRRLEEAWGVVGRMRARGVDPDVVTYNTVASAYAKNDETWRAAELVGEMVRARLRTSERTWGIIVAGYCREGRLEEALRCVRQMKEAGVLPNVIVFNTLLKGFLDANDMAAADDVLELMDQFGITPDIVTYSHQLNALSSLGHMAKCNKVFDRMVEAGIEPDPQVYSILAKGYVRAQLPGKAEELLKRMCRIGVRPNVVTFTTVISGWCSVADMDNATRVYRRMRDAGVRPNLRTFETLIWGYSEQKLPWKAQEVLQMMQEAGVRPKQSTYSLIADAWKAVGLVQNANSALGSPSPDDGRRGSANEPDHRSDDDDDADKLQRLGRTSDHPSHSSFVQVTRALGTSKQAGQLASPSPPSSLRRSCQLRMRSSGFCRNLWQKQGGLYSQGISSFKIMVFLS